MVAMAAMPCVTGVFMLVHRVFDRGHVATVYP